MRVKLCVVLLAFVLGELGCRGYMTKDPPFHLNPNMDTQERGKPYRESDFFSDKSYMRSPIEGTVARGKLKNDEHYYFGRVNGEAAKSFPKNFVIDEKVLDRGQLIYTRTCAACHGAIGDGDGLVGRRLLVKPTSLHSDYLYSLPPGHYFDVIMNGIRTMQPYKTIISVEDAWAVVSYVRSLQMSQDINGEWIKRSASWWKQN